MGSLNDEVWLVTGATSGFGKALSQRVLDRGGNLIATGRNTEALQHLKDIAPNKVVTVAADLGGTTDIEMVVKTGLACFGRIDALANVAGYGLLGALEELSVPEIEHQMQVNLFAPMHLIRAVLPTMRAQRSGTIINFSSTAGILGYAGTSLYSTSKWALEGLSECLSKELEPFNISVLIVEPGPFRTDFAGRSVVEAGQTIAAYENAAATRAYSAGMDGTQGGDPVRASDIVIDTVGIKGHPLRLVLGGPAFDEVSAGVNARLADIEASRTISSRADFSAE